MNLRISNDILERINDVVEYNAVNTRYSCRTEGDFGRYTRSIEGSGHDDTQQCTAIQDIQHTEQQDEGMYMHVIPRKWVICTTGLR